MTDHEFHRRRSEKEIASALKAADDKIALHHLSLARLHHSRSRMRRRQHGEGAMPIFRTDKEA